MRPHFAGGAEVGRGLAARLAGELLPGSPVVRARPRDGVPIGAELARRLNASPDLLLVRKIGAPWHPDLAVAAVVDGGQPEIGGDDAVAATGTSAGARG